MIVVTPRGAGPLAHHRRLGDAPFDWGRHGEGVYELAYGLLAETIGLRPPSRVCGLLEIEVLVHLPWDGFLLLERVLRHWLSLTATDQQVATWSPLGRA